MKNNISKNGLIIPVYINEKIVLDMLAIMEDGFSTVSQVNYTEHMEKNSAKKLDASASTTVPILSKLLKIDVSGGISQTGNDGKDTSVVKEKVHTNVSLLSKFRNFLIDEKILKSELDFSKIQVGDFVEIDGELEKNPLINYMDIFVDIFRLADIFTEEPQLGNKTQAKNQKQQDSKILKQIKSFSEELKHSGTIDFILSDERGTIVLSAQEQYLANDNVSEILGGHFKVLGKVISICKDENENIDLLRKTTLSVLSEGMLEEMFSDFKNSDMEQFNLPELVTKITGPAAIVIPVAIYA
ncbi:MAG: hypothetical protein SOU09_10525 [Faecalimonas umbilicata]|uniref:DUF6414 family protein n=1 Tax=Faecalimonas umbilicata TaxID=1912855 RepID=UPI002A754E9C|nr:hypothetical protein [Faecalimonas umbilicata]MDY2762481.1 hypothetical protein [Faecalimonas umbilicata]MDY4170904.1 hypothetical protein [Mediterraneibacter gnavus]